MKHPPFPKFPNTVDKLYFANDEWITVIVIMICLMAGIGGHRGGWGSFIGFGTWFISMQMLKIGLYLNKKKELKREKMYPLKMLGEEK